MPTTPFSAAKFLLRDLKRGGITVSRGGAPDTASASPALRKIQVARGTATPVAKLAHESGHVGNPGALRQILARIWTPKDSVAGAQHALVAERLANRAAIGGMKIYGVPLAARNDYRKTMEPYLGTYRTGLAQQLVKASGVNVSAADVTTTPTGEALLQKAPLLDQSRSLEKMRKRLLPGYADAKRRVSAVNQAELKKSFSGGRSHVVQITNPDGLFGRTPRAVEFTRLGKVARVIGGAVLGAGAGILGGLAVQRIGQRPIRPGENLAGRLLNTSWKGVKPAKSHVGVGLPSGNIANVVRPIGENPLRGTYTIQGQSRDKFGGGNTVTVTDDGLNRAQRMTAARKAVGHLGKTGKYNVACNNCENVARKISGRPGVSTQVGRAIIGGVAGAGVGALAAYAISKANESRDEKERARRQEMSAEIGAILFADGDSVTDLRDAPIERLIDAVHNNLPAATVPGWWEVQADLKAAGYAARQPLVKKALWKLVKGGVGAGVGAYIGNRALGKRAVKPGAIAGGAAGLIFSDPRTLVTARAGLEFAAKVRAKNL